MLYFIILLYYSFASISAQTASNQTSSSENIDKMLNEELAKETKVPISKPAEPAKVEKQKTEPTKTEQKPVPKPKTPVQTTEPEKETIESFDTNKDGIPELKRYYIISPTGERIMIRQELDLNSDGKVDYIYHYPKTGEVKNPIKIEVDHDFDGIFDEIRYYSPVDGSLSKKEIDINFDGKPEIIKRYYKGELIKKEIDTNGDGVMDYWEYYQNNRLVRTETDSDFDGKPDKVGKVESIEVYKFDPERFKQAPIPTTQNTKLSEQKSVVRSKVAKSRKDKSKGKKNKKSIKKKRRIKGK